jgi:hypothetical protein
MIRELPPDDVLERIGLESRLNEVREELRKAGQRQDAKVALLFSGEPVVGSTAIDARFAAEALHTFDRFVRRLLPKSTRPPREAKLPPAPEPILHLTAVVPGSFGFELREIQGGLLEGSSLAAAVGKALAIVSASAGNESLLADTLAEHDKLVASGLRDFLKTVAEGGAAVRLVAGDRIVPMSRDAVRLASERANHVTVEDSESEVPGEFRGVLAESRVFEHRADDGDLIRGRISEHLKPEDLAPLISKHCVATLRTAIIQHPAKTDRRHVLTGLRQD